MKYVPVVCRKYYAYVTCSSSRAQITFQPCHQLVKLRIMTIYIMLKMLLKFGASEMIYIELRAKKLLNVDLLL